MRYEKSAYPTWTIDLMAREAEGVGLPTPRFDLHCRWGLGGVDMKKRAGGANHTPQLLYSLYRSNLIIYRHDRHNRDPVVHHRVQLSRINQAVRPYANALNGKSELLGCLSRFNDRLVFDGADDDSATFGWRSAGATKHGYVVCLCSARRKNDLLGISAN